MVKVLIALVCITLITSSLAFSELPLNNLVAYWAFNEGQGKSVTDAINVYKGQVQDANWVDGKYGKALEFDGEKSFVSVNDVDKLKNFPEGLTLEAWVMITGKVDEFSVTVARKHPEYTLEVLAEMTARATVNSLWGAEWLMAKTKMEPNTWYHLALTCDSNVRRLYVSGKKEDEKPGVSLAPSSEALGIGKNVSQNMYFFPGIIDEVKVWNIALTAEQLQQSMKGENKPGAVELPNKLSVTWGDVKKLK